MRIRVLLDPVLACEFMLVVVVVGVKVLNSVSMLL